VHDEIILNLSRMDQIYGFDEAYGILSSQAGCILSNL
jgi:D-2-hydroxyglutarate dehydrogenase